MSHYGAAADTYNCLHICYCCHNTTTRCPGLQACLTCCSRWSQSLLDSSRTAAVERSSSSLCAHRSVKLMCTVSYAAAAVAVTRAVQGSPGAPQGARSCDALCLCVSLCASLAHPLNDFVRRCHASTNYTWFHTTSPTFVFIHAGACCEHQPAVPVQHAAARCGGTAAGSDECECHGACCRQVDVWTAGL